MLTLVLPPIWGIPGATGPFLLSPGRPEVGAQEPQTFSRPIPCRHPEQKGSLQPGTASGLAVDVCGGVLRLRSCKEGKGRHLSSPYQPLKALAEWTPVLCHRFPSGSRGRNAPASCLPPPHPSSIYSAPTMCHYWLHTLF